MAETTIKSLKHLKSTSNQIAPNHRSETEIPTSSIISQEIIDECREALQEEDMSNLKSLAESTSPEDKIKLQNRVRQAALNVRKGKGLPKNYHMFNLVLQHLFKNSHRYFNVDQPTELQKSFMANDSFAGAVDSSKTIEDMKDANRRVRVIGGMKSANRVQEQKEMVSELKSQYGSYRDISRLTGIPLKRLFGWCSLPKDKVHKKKELARLRRAEFEMFLNQDTVTYEHPCKKLAGKKFLRDTWLITRDRYLSQPEFHTYGILSLSSMKAMRPKHVYLCNQTPLAQCLCDKCENCEQLLKSLHAMGIQGVPANRYKAIAALVCPQTYEQFGCNSDFPAIDCILGTCKECGIKNLLDEIRKQNPAMYLDKRSISWRKWMKKPDSKAPHNCHITASIQQAIDQLMDMVKDLTSHLFRSKWHRNLFDYIRNPENLLFGYIVQIFDFAMNFKNIQQDEVQSAHWDGTQTSIHTVINYFKCMQQGCAEIVTLVLCQISDDLNHDSFLARAAHDATFKFLAHLGVPMDVIIQFCDNCAAQYKSRRPFAELARSALNIIRVYFGEKHGKGQCDGFFGRLKAWMTHHIKARKVIINNAHDFFRYCQEKYQTPEAEEGKCQHYRVHFQFIKKGDVKRHQDCNIDKAIPGTRSIFSVRNTEQPLTLKVKQIPCICPHCIKEDGQQCLNFPYSDPWKEVKLCPIKGEGRRKHMKRKDPRDFGLRTNIKTQTTVEESDMPEVVITRIENEPDELSDTEVAHEDFIDLTETSDRGRQENNASDKIVDLTEKNLECVDNVEEVITVEDVEDRHADSLMVERERRKLSKKSTYLPTFDNVSHEEVPDDIFWESVLCTFESCEDYNELEEVARRINSENITPIRPRNLNSRYCPSVHRIDSVAASMLPSDCPQDVHPARTRGDGNCLPRALSIAYIGDESMHLEIRARIVLEGILNKNKYINEDYLKIGCTTRLSEESITVAYAKYSDFYVSGQRITDESIDCLYSMEIYECAKYGSYMGLWQIAQAATVLDVPIQSVYPSGCDIEMRKDFHRFFHPVTRKPSFSDQIIIMWTGLRRGHSPLHFVPLL